MLPSPKPITPFNLCRANETDIVHIRQLPVRQQVETKEQFIETVRYVHAMGHYHNQERATDNWLSADVIALDIDNDGQPTSVWDKPEDWTTIQQFQADFSDYEFWIVESKNHNKNKRSNSGIRVARPKFHVYFPLQKQLTDPNKYQQSIQTIVGSYCRSDGISRFDINATDLARIFTGDFPEVGYHITEDQVYHQSGKSILDYVYNRLPILPSQSNSKEISPNSPKITQFQVSSYQKGWRYQNLISNLEFEDIFEGVEKGKITSSNWMVTFCPLHGERRGSSRPSLNINMDTYKWKCHSGCSHGKVLDAMDFMAKNSNMSLPDVVDELCQNFGIKNRDVTQSSNETEYDDIVLEQLQLLNHKYAVLKQGSKVGIMHTEYDDLQQTHVPRVGMRSSDFKLLNPQSVRHKNRKAKLASLWLDWEGRRTYQGLIFDPSGRKSPNNLDKWNLWDDWSTATPDNNWRGDPDKSGFVKQLDPKIYQRMKGLSNQQLEYNCKHYLQLIRQVICGNQKKRVGLDTSGEPFYQTDIQKVEKLYDWLLNWIADAFQNPAKHSRVCSIVLRSKEGTGKGKFINDTLGKLFRPHYFHLTGDADKLTGKFNAWMRDNLLIFSDEAVWGGNRNDVGKMKSLITERERTVEEKFVDATQYANYSRVICASNDSWVVYLTESDRRWQFIDVSEEFATENIRNKEQADGKSHFFQSIDDEWNNGGKEAFFELMMRRNIDGFDFPKERVITLTYYEQLRESDPMVGWFEQCIEKEEIAGPDDLFGTSIRIRKEGTEIIDTEFVYNSYRDYLKKTDQNYQWTGDFKEFSKRLRKLLNSDSNVEKGFSSRRKWETDRTSKTIWVLSSLTVLKQIYNQKAGGGDVLFSLDG